jgi:hypothetical protein
MLIPDWLGFAFMGAGVWCICNWTKALIIVFMHYSTHVSEITWHKRLWSWLVSYTFWANPKNKRGPKPVFRFVDPDANKVGKRRDERSEQGPWC